MFYAHLQGKEILATKKSVKQSDGKYHKNGKKFDLLIGTRAQVWHGTALKTSGGLEKSDLHMNKNNRIVFNYTFFRLLI